MLDVFFRCNVSSLTRGHDTCVTMLSVSCDNMHVASGDQSGQVSVEIYLLISEENDHGNVGHETW